MKRLIYGMILGFILCLVFIYMGGGEYIKSFGRETSKVGEKVIDYEGVLKEKVKKAKKAAGEAKEAVKEKAGAAKKAVREKTDAAHKVVE